MTNDEGNRWPFSDPPNVAVFISKKILSGEEWIYYVAHDEDDGAWQFHPQSGFMSENDASIVSLKRVCEFDPSVEKLSHLPLGWVAWRDEKDLDWTIQKRDTE